MRNLQKELDEEKQARLKLEREIAEIRKINSELSTTIGLMGK
jgi:predicted  nucleic acid-binding Zn-ribbon protein